MYYSVCHFTGIFLCFSRRQISVLFIDNNEYSVFCILKKRQAEVIPSFFLSLLLLSFSSRFYIYKFAVVVVI